jgi:EmrB/QacA subfamily drug resistance transporter
VPPEVDEAGGSGAGRAVAAIILCQLMIMVDGVIVTVALPHMRADLGLDPTALSWVVSGYAVAFAALLLVAGRVGAIIGPRRALLIGVGVFVVASAAGGLAPDGALLVAARVLQGAGAALAAPAVLVLLTALTSEGPSRLRAMSWYVIASSAGSGIGLIAGGLLTVSLGWRWVMFVNVPIGVLVIAGVLVFARETGRSAGPVDVPGAALSAIAMVGLVYGLTRTGESGWADPVALLALVAALAAVAALVVVERRADRPVVPMALLRAAAGTRYLALALLVAALIGFFTFSVLLLSDVRGLDALQIGLAYLPWAASVVIGGRLVPRLVPRIGGRATVTLGAVAVLAGLVAFVFLGTGTPLWLGVLLPCFVIGFGPALVFTPLTDRILAAAPPRDAGAAAALMQSMQQLGGALGVATLATVYAANADLGTAGAVPVALWAAVAFGVALLLLVVAVPGLSAEQAERTDDPVESGIRTP